MLDPEVNWPAASTFGNILRRAGLTSPKRKKRRTTPYSEPFSEERCCVGEVFTSPSSDSVFAAITAVSGVPGALLVVKNYTGG
jgi:hypothetical protein